MHRIALAAFSCLLFCGCAPPRPPAPAPAADHDLAVYDLLLGPERVVVVDSTFPGASADQVRAMVSGGLLSAETADDFLRANQSRRGLPDALRTDERTLIAGAELPRGPLQEERRAWDEFRARHGVDGVRYVSAVGYNARRTEAVVAEGWTRGPLESVGTAIILRRDGSGPWRVTSRTMLWIS